MCLLGASAERYLYLFWFSMSNFFCNLLNRQNQKPPRMRNNPAKALLSLPSGSEKSPYFCVGLGLYRYFKVGSFKVDKINYFLNIISLLLSDFSDKQISCRCFAGQYLRMRLGAYGNKAGGTAGIPARRISAMLSQLMKAG